jgi:peptidase C39-like protein
MTIIGLFGAGAFTRRDTGSPYPISNFDPIKRTAVELSVLAIVQSKTTSCGEAAIVMALNYAHPEEAISEAAVIDYAVRGGTYTPVDAPFTSPADMVRLAQHYTGQVSTGYVITQEQGLELLAERLNKGEPVIIDVTTLLSDPQSGAHFVVVTGVTIDAFNAKASIKFNNPLTGRNQSADWYGSEGIWQVWQNNGDPGGTGWWLTMPRGVSTWLP